MGIIDKDPTKRGQLIQLGISGALKINLVRLSHSTALG
jgi:hypothetical protein